MFPHSKREPEEYGHSPGNGTTSIRLSREPLATEGEATPGPDDYNPYDEIENERAMRRIRENNKERRSPKLNVGLSSAPQFGDAAGITSGDDPFAFDDAGEILPTLELPEPRGKRANLDFLNL